jgi:glyoxylase I family protein
MLGIIHHLALTVTDLTASRAFYQPILSFLGYSSLSSFPGFDLWTAPETGATLTFWQAKSELMHHQHNDYAPGLHHLAFAADTHDRVDKFYQLLQKLNAVIVEPPAQYDYAPGYYAVFFRDPDNLRVELVYTP